MPPRGKRSAPEPVQPRRGKALKGIEPEPVPAELGVNAEIQAALSKCDDIILEKWSKGILTDQPTALSGVPEYNAARAKAALDGGNKYTASVPLSLGRLLLVFGFDSLGSEQIPKQNTCDSHKKTR